MIIIIIFSFPLQVYSLTMTNAFYMIQMGNLNSIAGITNGSNYKLSLTSGETGSGLYSLNGVNYKVRAGFQYIRSVIEFAFSISNPNVDFGTLSPGNAVNRASTLTVSNGSANGYIVTGMQAATKLQNPATGVLIPDTTCDSGTCTITAAKPWVLNADGTSTTYGFGYNCTNLTGSECPVDFTDSTYFRPFPGSPSAVTVMSNSNAGRNQQVNITYRVNISGSQQAGVYSDVITYVATPTY